MLKLSLTFEVVTPLFLGDADRTRAVLRPSAFKGLLRFWYRAVDPEFREYERLFLGGVGRKDGQSSVLLSIESPPLRRVRWGDFKDGRFNIGHGKNRQNGLVYLGFPLRMKGGAEREAIAPGQRFTLSCVVPRQVEEMERFRRAMAAAFWLFAHFGAIGTRARRGFGVLSLKEWGVQHDGWPEIAELPVVSHARDIGVAQIELNRGLETIRAWLGEWPVGREHPHLGAAFAHKLIHQPYRDWSSALADMGAAMQEFRSRRAPDYQAVKDHLTGRRRLTRAPERVTFGLPLAFRYTSLQGKSTQLYSFREHDRERYGRHGSLLFLRLLQVGEVLHPHYVRMAGAVPGVAPPAILRGDGRPLRKAVATAMDTFFGEIKTGK